MSVNNILCTEPGPETVYLLVVKVLDFDANLSVNITGLKTVYCTIITKLF